MKVYILKSFRDGHVVRIDHDHAIALHLLKMHNLWNYPKKYCLVTTTWSRVHKYRPIEIILNDDNLPF